MSAIRKWSSLKRACISCIMTVDNFKSVFPCSQGDMKQIVEVLVKHDQ